MDFSKFLTEYFIKYASVSSQSDSSKQTLPSSEVTVETRAERVGEGRENEGKETEEERE